MKLKQIEEIATTQVPVWQPALLVTLLSLGFFAVPFLAKKTPPVEKKVESLGTTLGVDDVKKQIYTGVKNAAQPLSNQIQKDAEAVLGIAQQAVQQTVQNIASQSATQAKEFVFDATLGKVLQNINTLPADQQDLIKKAICK